MASSAATGSEIEWPSNASYYDLGHAIGKGATAVVYHATCKTNQRQVAIKIIDLENCPAEIDDIRVRADAQQQRRILAAFSSLSPRSHICVCVCTIARAA